jgi:sulfoxide reductase heme-binding subunit YedZ
MGGKAWQRVHRLVYLAAIAGIIHYWWQVKKDNLAPWKDTAILTILLLARVVYTLIKRRGKPTPALKST